MTSFVLRTLLRECITLLLLFTPILITLVTTAEAAQEEADVALPLLFVRLAAVLVMARLASSVITNFIFWPIRRFIPGLLQLVLHAYHGWPTTAICWIGAIIALTAVDHPDHPAWEDLQREERRFWPVAIWLLCGAITRGAWEAVLQSWLDNLTLRHFEMRTKTAYGAHKTLRRIAAAAWAAERRSSVERRGSVLARAKTMTALFAGATPTVASAAGEGRQRWNRLVSQLGRLSGPFDLGAGFADALTVAQARKRAVKVFRILSQQSELCVQQGAARTVPLADAASAASTNASAVLIQRELLLRWPHHSYGLEGMDVVTAAADSARALPTLAENIDEENFVGSVERCYKEQRFLTASVQSFSRTHQLLRQLCIYVWAGAFLAFGFFAWGVDLAAWVIPSASALLSVIFLLGRVPADFAAGATYAIIVRPFDIGDRITLSSPGADPTMFSLVVKHIDLMRTHLITSQGQTLILENHAIRNLSVTNLSRSGPQTLLINLQVPSSTSASKMTELVDSIRAYVAEKSSEWSNADLMFSQINLEKGYVNLQVWVECVFPAHEVSAIYSARSRLLLFVHAYMQTANIEYSQPVLPVRGGAL